MTEVTTNPGQDGPVYEGLKSPFLRRTAIATLVTVGLVALNAAVYFDRGWAGRYLFAGLWALGMFGLTALIIKEFMFTHRPLIGLGLMGVKVAMIAVMILACAKWSRGQTGAAAFGSSLAAGVSTPLVVIVLRSIGSQMKSTPAGARHD